VLQGAQAGAVVLPVCDHYCGVEVRMRKSLRLQAEMQQEFGVCVFDVTLDCEDGAPVGGEVEHAQLVAELVQSADANARVAVRVHPVDHPSFHTDINEIVATVGQRLCHVMLPKVESLADIDTAVKAIDQAGAQGLAVHALIESPAAVHRAFDIAAHPRLQSLSFGLMDFVSAHAGAIASTGMDAEGPGADGERTKRKKPNWF
jgi:citrate lyase subunit beta/citryl-CoA lyase